MDAWEKRMQAMYEASNKQHLARMERIDRRLDGITKLLQQGAKIMIEIETSQRELVKSLRTIPRNGHTQGKK